MNWTAPRRRLALALLLCVLLIAAALAWRWSDGDELPDWIVAGNGRLEATAIDVSTKAGGRILDVKVRDGDFVRADDEIGRMDTQSLQAQLRSAEAQSRQAEAARVALASVVRQREQAVRTVEALVAQRTAETALAERELKRTSELVAQNFISPQQLDAAESRVRASRAALEAARSQRLEAEAAVVATRSQLGEAQAGIESARAAVERVQVEIADALLRAPRNGRVQTVLAHAGEVLAPGGRVVTLVDLGDVTMSFFLPERAAGRVAIGGEARLVLDAAPDVVIPATVDFVASVAQFTPKTVETESERQKMVFKVRARVSPELLERYREQVKTGLPGVAYVRLGEQPWPARLAVRVPSPAASSASAAGP
ncbi:MAG: HlyD family efflux transporter periplasmic adaptor subunit [Burkholderiales bacterium]|nr:HlyD family efflux transporter periplasmic adaptor subunit [Burkholderiales bacterium]